MATKDNDVSYWNATTKLTVIALAIWAFFSFVVHFFAPALNAIQIPLLKFPLGYYMASQGSLVAFVALVFWFCAKQEQIDRDHGNSEE